MRNAANPAVPKSTGGDRPFEARPGLRRKLPVDNPEQQNQAMQRNQAMQQRTCPAFAAGLVLDCDGTTRASAR